MTKLLLTFFPFYFLFACGPVKREQTNEVIAKLPGAQEPAKCDSLLHEISGTWRWKRSGSNWGIDEEEKPGVLERKLVVRENNELEFYENDSLMRTERFTVSFFGETAVLYFLPSREPHTCRFEGAQLIIGGDPFCACGCNEDEYVR